MAMLCINPNHSGSQVGDQNGILAITQYMTIVGPSYSCIAIRAWMLVLNATGTR